jgi:hypothetical protein
MAVLLLLVALAACSADPSAEPCGVGEACPCTFDWECPNPLLERCDLFGGQICVARDVESADTGDDLDARDVLTGDVDDAGLDALADIARDALADGVDAALDDGADVDASDAQGETDGGPDTDASDTGDAGSDADADVISDTDIGPSCGDGVVEGSESCDDGETNSDTDPDACRSDCTLARCGDGVVDAGDACDDADDVDDNACSNECVEVLTLLCTRCDDSAECGRTQDLCVELGGAAYCAIACGEADACPDGFSCTDLIVGEETRRQCLPDAGACDGCVDADADGYGIGLDCLGPDCADDPITGPDVFPGADEVCDGIDNDCDRATPDGIAEPTFGDECDNPGDSDLCTDGTIVCDPLRRLVCGDNRASLFEVCDGEDNDCNPDTPDGFDEADLGDACDSPDDTDLCADGVVVCAGVDGLACNDDAISVAEICDGEDNDCDGTRDEVADIEGLGDACMVTGALGVCEAGYQVCRGGSPGCEALTAAGDEICGTGADEDCDGSADEVADCLERPPGDLCPLAIDASGAGVFAGTFEGYADEFESFGCGGAGVAPNVFYRVEVDVPTDLSVAVTSDASVTALLVAGPCPAGFGFSECLDAFDLSSRRRLEPGVWFVVLEAAEPVEYELLLVLHDPASGACLPADEDSDPVTLCDGDCKPEDDTIYPGAAERCNGVDDDCDGSVDELPSSCVVPGGFGICAPGVPVCDGDAIACEPLAAARDEVCGNGVDDDCDGATDEVADCVEPLSGDLCDSPDDASALGAFAGTFDGYYDDQDNGCWGPAPADRFYAITVGPGGGELIVFERSGELRFSLYDTCEAGAFECPEAGVGAGVLLEPDTDRVLEVEGTGEYAFALAVFDFGTGECTPANGDSDEFTLCDGDCDDTDGDAFPGALERCNGVDDDCDGDVDDIAGTCTVDGVDGICAVGAPTCDGVTLGCEQTEFGRDEVCGNGADDDCDGSVDELDDCPPPPIGDTCEDAEDASDLGTFTGDLSGYADDTFGFCGAPGGVDRFYAYTAPGAGVVTGTIVSGDVVIALHEGVCGFAFDCAETPGEPYEFSVSESGEYFFEVDGSGSYTVSFAFALR